MSNFLLLIICLILGMIFRKTKIFPENSHKVLNAIIINLSLPALTILYVHSFRFSVELLFSVFMPYIIFGMAYFVFNKIGHHYKMDKKTIGCLILVCGLGNTSFLGLPMIEVFFGSGGIPIGLIIDQLGSFLVLSTLGILTADYYSGKISSEDISIVKKVMTFPPFISIIIALILIPVDYPDVVTNILEKLGMTLSPLALLSVGYQLKFDKVGLIKDKLTLGIVFKLVIFPIVIYFLYSFFMNRNDLVFKITVFEAAMPPMITAAIVASDYDLNPKLANLLVGVGIIFAFITLSIWYLILGG